MQKMYSNRVWVRGDADGRAELGEGGIECCFAGAPGVML